MYRDHPEFADFDFDAPGNIRGVPGNRTELPGGELATGPANIHNLITQRWNQFARDLPNATRPEIEDFAGRINAEFEGYFWR
jgi:hypothetical protein